MIFYVQKKSLQRTFNDPYLYRFQAPDPDRECGHCSSEYTTDIYQIEL